MGEVDYSVIPWERLPLFCKYFLLCQLGKNLRDLSLSLSLSRATSKWKINTHKLNLSTWVRFIWRKGWRKNFRATGKTSYYNKYSWHCPFLFRLDLLMAVVSHALRVSTKIIQLEYLMQNFLSKMTSQGAFI